MKFCEEWKMMFAGFTSYNWFCVILGYFSFAFIFLFAFIRKLNLYTWCVVRTVGLALPLLWEFCKHDEYAVVCDYANVTHRIIAKLTYRLTYFIEMKFMKCCLLALQLIMCNFVLFLALLLFAISIYWRIKLVYLVFCENSRPSVASVVGHWSH